ncbi:MAG: galactokinase [Verrucomicrobia bacterium]|nr:galactokinase [Verrucomicrobiota bacterium]
MNALLAENFRSRFGRGPLVTAHAPGRIEFIGNHTDYNGGTVLGASIDRRVQVAVAPRNDGRWRFASEAKPGFVEMTASAQPARRADAESWANYPLGVLSAFREFGLRTPGGLDFLAASDLPAGAGLSSSAALELASALAFLELSGQQAARDTVVKLCRHAENHFVGVPCGILDQGVSGFGKKDHLVFIDCAGPSFAAVPLPEGVRFWIFNTHVKHALVDGLYAARHRECMEAAEFLGVSLLAEIAPATLAAAQAGLPEIPFRRARHVVDEIARVNATVAALRAGDLDEVGRRLTASHRSSRDLFENSTPELDFLVDRLAGAENVYGARLTGGGFGGAVMAFTHAGYAAADAERVVEAYAEKFGNRPDVLPVRTADGAALD